MTFTIAVYEDALWQNMLPLTYLRPTCLLTCGRGSLLEKIERLHTSAQSSWIGHNGNGRQVSPAQELNLWCRDELSQVLSEDDSHPINQRTMGPTLFLNGRGWWKSFPAMESTESAWVGIAGKEEHIACVFADAELAAKLSPRSFLQEEELRTVTPGSPQAECLLAR